MSMQINSLIIEGKIHSVSEQCKDRTGKDMVTVDVLNKWEDPAHPGEVETGLYTIEVHGKVFASFGKYLVPGKVIRVVGRLVQHTQDLPDGDVALYTSVMADHVDPRPY